jgi:hypothetical protein
MFHSRAMVNSMVISYWYMCWTPLLCWFLGLVFLRHKQKLRQQVGESSLNKSLLKSLTPLDKRFSPLSWFEKKVCCWAATAQTRVVKLEMMTL